MKKISVLIAAVALAAAANGRAERGATLDLAGCTSELESHYGQGVQVDIVNKRRHRYGTRVRLAVRLDADNTQFANCWVPVNAIATLEADDRKALVAASKPAEAEK